MSRIAVVIPCYNTSAACRDVIARVSAHASTVLAVDDGSTDDTANHLRASGCDVLTLPVNSGKGAALAAGIRRLLDDPTAAAFDYLVTIDGDGQHDPADIPRLAAHARDSRADLVLGMRDAREMPPRSKVGSHFSRLLFLIGTGRYVADTQSGYRLFSRDLIAALLPQIAWKGYETESEVLWRAAQLERTITALPISTIYFDGNRRTQFNAWRDSTRIASVFAAQLRWTVSMAMLDFAAFCAFVLLGGIDPVRANLASRALAVLAQAALRRDYVSRTRLLVRSEGLGWVLLAFAGHLALTTSLVAALVRGGLPPAAAKAGAQLAGYLGTFLAVDAVLLRRAMRGSSVRS